MGSPERKLAWAIRARSVAEIERLHERNYRNIYGSQILALKALNAIGGVAKGEDFRPFYDTAASTPEFKGAYENRSFELWGEFLIDAGYVEVVEGTEPLQVRLTIMGADFLHWLVRSRAPEFKPG